MTAIITAFRSRRFRLIAVLVLFVAAAAILGHRVVLIWQKNDAVRTARDGNFAAAEEDLRAALARNPADAEVVEVLALGTLAAGDPAEGEAFLDRWTRLQPYRPEPHRVAFEHYRKVKNWERALTAGLKLRELESGDPQSLRLLVTVAFEAARFEIADELCRELIRSQPGNPGFRVTRAAIRRGLNDTAGSIALLDEVLREHPQFTPALADRAAAFEEAGEPAKAIPMLREVLKLDRQRQRSAGYRLSVALDRNGEPEEARKVLVEVRRLQDVSTVEEAIKNQPNDSGLRTRLGETLLAAGHFVDGIRIVSSAFELDPGFAPAHRVLAEHYEKNAQPARAAEHRRYLKMP